MDFKDLLTKQGFDLDKVMVLRHRPTEPKAGAGVAADTGDVHTHDHDTQKRGVAGFGRDDIDDGSLSLEFRLQRP